MLSYLETRKSSYAAQRGASQGAGITLVSHAGEYVASFDCARHCAEVLGRQGAWLSIEDSSVQSYKIPLAEMHAALLKLSARFSVALVELVAEKDSTRFVLVWKIPANRNQNWGFDPAIEGGDKYVEIKFSPSPAEPEPCTLTLEDF